MIIKSNYRDYYDWAYPEESNYTDVTYDRTSLTCSNPDRQTIEVISQFYSRYVENQRYRLYTDRISQVAGIVVSDTFYACVKNAHNDKWELLKYKDGRPSTESSQNVLDLARSVGQPVFSIRDFICDFRKGKVITALIDKKIPKLADYGFPAEFLPEDMYNKIDYFVRNLVHVVPDGPLQATLTDIEKVNAHGFDNVISFRHRK